MARFDLSDDEWAEIVANLPTQGRGPRRKDDRMILNGSSTSCAPGRPRAIFLSVTAPERPSTTAMSGGVSVGSGDAYSRPVRQNVKMP